MLESPRVVGVALLLFLVECRAATVAGFDTVRDTVQTSVRIPAGIVRALGAVGEVDTASQVVAALAAGTLTGVPHAASGPARGCGSIPRPNRLQSGAAATGDVAGAGGRWAALFHPVVFLVLPGPFALRPAWLLPRIRRGMAAAGCPAAGCPAAGCLTPGSRRARARPPGRFSLALRAGQDDDTPGG